MIIILALFILGAVLYTATHGLLAVTFVVALLGTAGVIMFAVMRAHTPKKLPQRSTSKHWDYAEGNSSEED